MSSAAVLALLLAACAADPPAAIAVADEARVRRVPVPDLDLPQVLPGGAVLDDAWELRSALPITGLSAMALHGERLLLATDAGEMFETSCPAGLPLSGCAERWRYGGRLVARGAPRADVEALAIRPDGSVILGLENLPRLALLAGEGQGGYRIERLADAPDLGFLPKNDGPEAMTSLPDGRLIVLPEGGVDQDARALVLLQDRNGAWKRHRIALPDASLRPVEAAVAGDHLFVLLRSFGLLAGWHGEILALPLAGLEAPGEMLPEPRSIATITDQPIADNHEAMAVRRLADGSYSILVASDDNALMLQRKLLLALSWSEEQAQAGRALGDS
ncbi:esterase-like activity of phytase family protein [Geminicoccus roseus]|uniref:esterase-like activity of phytase family protein n=1 Tax=Geminicoccus roseus TaxID=404900 RepID=UPI0004844A51|nr:esterase-like activity of phytase family protein [Geminicoccus roseus]